MHPFDKDGHDCCHTDVDEVLNVLDGFLLIVVQTKLVLYLKFHIDGCMILSKFDGGVYKSLIIILLSPYT